MAREGAIFVRQSPRRSGRTPCTFRLALVGLPKGCWLVATPVLRRSRRLRVVMECGLSAKTVLMTNVLSQSGPLTVMSPVDRRAGPRVTWPLA